MGLTPLVLHLPLSRPQQVCPAGSDPSLWLLDRRQHRLLDRNGQLTSQGLMLQHWLSPSELERLRRLRRHDDQERALLAWAGLRALLGQALNLAPGQVPLARSPWGKPHLSGAAQGVLQFNLSHAGELVLIGLHRHAPLGIDLEPLHGQSQPLGQLERLAIARQLFPAAVVDVLRQLPEQQQEHCFLQQWCQLEARQKAWGTGLHTRPAEAAMPATIRDIGVELPSGYVGHCCLLLTTDLPQIRATHQSSEQRSAC
jgi:phosphopantetheinyl transferase